MKPCKHLDYSLKKYEDACDLITEKDDLRLAGFSCEVKYWRRKPHMLPEGARQNVQFCRLRGRINEVFCCYNPGEMSCHEVEDRP